MKPSENEIILFHRQLDGTTLNKNIGKKQIESIESNGEIVRFNLFTAQIFKN